MLAETLYRDTKVNWPDHIIVFKDDQITRKRGLKRKRVIQT